MIGKAISDWNLRTDDPAFIEKVWGGEAFGIVRPWIAEISVESLQ